MTRPGFTRRQVLQLSGVLTSVGAAGCTQFITSGENDDISDSDGDGVINTEDYAPWDESVQEKSQLVGQESEEATAGQTETTTGTSTVDEAREYRFEEGLDGWKPVWAGPNDCPDDPGLQHETGSKVIDGDGSALFTTECDSNLVATPTFDVNTSKDFTVSVDFYFEDEDSRGLFIHLYSSDQNGSPDNRVRAGDYSHRLVRARRRPAENQQSVSAVGHETRVEQGTINTGTTHTLVATKSGDTISATLDGEPLIERPIGDATWKIGESYRVMLVHSAAWGAPSKIWFDSVSITHK